MVNWFTDICKEHKLDTIPEFTNNKKLSEQDKEFQNWQISNNKKLKEKEINLHTYLNIKTKYKHLKPKLNKKMVAYFLQGMCDDKITDNETLAFRTKLMNKNKFSLTKDMRDKMIQEKNKILLKNKYNNIDINS